MLTRLEQAPETGKSVQKRRLEPGFLAFLGRNRNDFRQRAGTKSFFSSLLDDGNDKAAQAMGKKGGAARAASMTPERRAEIAKKAAAKCWGKE
ncbi:MAG: hypothetical protein IOD01_03675 [Rhodobacter sp.]|nr:hypothetical protein [Rhodobacter sp.]